MLTNSPAWMKTYSEIQETIYIGICSLIPPCDWIPSTVTSARWMIVLGRCGEFWAVDARSDMYVPIFVCLFVCSFVCSFVCLFVRRKRRTFARGTPTSSTTCTSLRCEKNVFYRKGARGGSVKKPIGKGDSKAASDAPIYPLIISDAYRSSV